MPSHFANRIIDGRQSTSASHIPSLQLIVSTSRLAFLGLLTLLGVHSISSAMSVAKLLSSLDGKSGARLVSTVEKVLRELEDAGLAWRARINPRQVGVHPQNRGGWGVSPGQVHKLGSDIFVMGW